MFKQVNLPQIVVKIELRSSNPFTTLSAECRDRPFQSHSIQNGRFISEKTRNDACWLFVYLMRSIQSHPLWSNHDETSNRHPGGNRSLFGVPAVCGLHRGEQRILARRLAQGIGGAAR